MDDEVVVIPKEEINNEDHKPQIEPIPDIPDGSPLKLMMAPYLKEANNIKEDIKKEEDEIKIPEDVKFDEETHREELIKYLKENKEFSEDKFNALGLNETQTNRIKEIFPDHFKVKEDLTDEFKADLETLEKPALIDEVKKNQKIISERLTEIETLKKENEELKSTEKTVQYGEDEASQALKLLKEDFKANYSKVSEKFKLPSVDNLVEQITQSDNVVARLSHYQKNVLIPEVEKKFGLIEGEFEYSSNEASDAKSASAYYDRMSKLKEGELLESFQSIKRSEQERLVKLETQEKEDIKWFADTYEDGSIEKVHEKLNNMNEIANSISLGKTKDVSHPFSIKNLLKGFYHDELVKIAEDKAVEAVKAEYAKNGIHLPGNESPVDITKINTNHNKEEDAITKEMASESPMMASMRNTLSIIKH